MSQTVIKEILIGPKNEIQVEKKIVYTKNRGLSIDDVFSKISSARWLNIFCILCLSGLIFLGSLFI